MLHHVGKNPEALGSVPKFTSSAVLKVNLVQKFTRLKVISSTTAYNTERKQHGQETTETK